MPPFDRNEQLTNNNSKNENKHNFIIVMLDYFYRLTWDNGDGFERSQDSERPQCRQIAQIDSHRHVPIPCFVFVLFFLGVWWTVGDVAVDTHGHRHARRSVEGNRSRRKKKRNKKKKKNELFRWTLSSRQQIK